MNSEVAWVLVSSGTQVQPQIIIDPDYLPDYLPFLMTMISNFLKNILGKFGMGRFSKRQLSSGQWS